MRPDHVIIGSGNYAPVAGDGVRHAADVSGIEADAPFRFSLRGGSDTLAANGPGT